MVFVEYTIKKADISFEGTLEFEEFLEHIKDWFVQHGYEVNEKTYLALPNKRTDLKWECVKKYDDYHKLIIATKTSMTPKEEIKVKRRVTECSLKFAYEGSIKRDPDDRWVGKRSFIWRAFIDKFIALEKEKAVRKELNNDVESLRKEVKKYLNV